MDAKSVVGNLHGEKRREGLRPSARTNKSEVMKEKSYRTIESQSASLLEKAFWMFYMTGKWDISRYKTICNRIINTSGDYRRNILVMHNWSLSEYEAHKSHPRSVYAGY